MASDHQSGGSLLRRIRLRKASGTAKPLTQRGGANHLDYRVQRENVAVQFVSRNRRRRALLLGALALGALRQRTFAAGTREVRISKGFGILYLPLLVMEKMQLLEKHAVRHNAGDVVVRWVLLDGGSSINDAMMANTLDFAGTGAPGFIDLWSKARGIPNVEVVGVSGLSATSLWLNSNRKEIRSLHDFTAADRIAVPGIKTSLSAVVLQMASAKILGASRFADLDAITVNYPHPEAMRALIAREQGITAHFTSPPFSYLEVQYKNVHRVLSSVDVLGNITLDVVFAPKKFTDSNPELVSAFLDALDEANHFIATNVEAAAAMFVAASKVTVSVGAVTEMLRDPDTRYSTIPHQVMDYMDFLYSIGTIKNKAQALNELFVPQLWARHRT
ncbi:ABC transporter substrate-binding protein [Paraburkholderia sediminicola]|uniref:ABC transporter substrate-binding protein n=1 Tax=Paraburkholderia sediminicola TaxID=458836 RepID=UPI0038B8556C